MKDHPSIKAPNVGDSGPSLEDLNLLAVLRVVVAFALSVLLASTAPAGLALAFFNIPCSPQNPKILWRNNSKVI